VENFALFAVDISFFIIFFSSLFLVGFVLIKRGNQGNKRNLSILGLSFVFAGVGTLGGLILNLGKMFSVIFKGITYMLMIVFTNQTFYKNVRSYGIEETGLIISDARMLPLKRVDCISTDPPYGRSSTTMGLKIRDLLSDFLYNLKDVIKKDGFISIAAPIEVEVGNMGRDIGYVLVETYQMRVHRSLTREIAVLKAV